MKVCPFCDVVTDVPHQTQEACIDALQQEIARTRRVLERRTAALSRGPSGPVDCLHDPAVEEHRVVARLVAPQRPGCITFGL